MNEAFIGSSTTEPFDPEKHDGLLFDSGAALNVCPKHYVEEIPIQPLPDTCNLRITNGQRLQTYGLRTVRYELTDRQRKIHLYVDCVVCDADRPILSVVRLLESEMVDKTQRKTTIDGEKDDVRIELTTHRGLLYVESDAPNTTREDDATEASRSCVPHQPQETEDCLRRPDSTNR